MEGVVRRGGGEPGCAAGAGKGKDLVQICPAEYVRRLCIPWSHRTPSQSVPSGALQRGCVGPGKTAKTEMAVRIRLKRMGRKKQPHYRVVVADSRSPRDGRFVESLGYFKPLSHPARLVLDLDRIDYWIGEGASPSNTVKTLITKARQGGDDKVALGEIDAELRREAESEKLAARRAAEKQAEADAAAEAAAKAEAEAAAKAQAEAAEAVDADAETAAEGETADEAEPGASE